MDASINHAGLIYTKPETLEFLYRQYIDIGHKYNLPIMLMTLTRKVNFESIRKSKFQEKNIITDSCSFLNRIIGSYEGYSQNILLGGLLGCKGDAYSSTDALSIEESFKFHRVQISQFKKENIDFLFAGIMPEINEAVGMAQAMAETEVPYIISFMIRKDGCLIDGTPLSDAISLIDEKVDPQPICFMANCIHPTNLRLALRNDKNKNKQQLARFKGIQANASILSPEELNNCKILHQEDFNTMIDEMEVLFKLDNLKIFGGCCGTNEIFIEKLSRKLKTH